MTHDPRLTTHPCKHCGAILALIDDRSRCERFALRCAACGVRLVLRPFVKIELSTSEVLDVHTYS